MTVLDRIFEHKAEEVAAREKLVPLGEMRSRAESAPMGKDFLAAIRGACGKEEGAGRAAVKVPGDGGGHLPRRLGIRRLALIAELKKASPSKGLLRSDFDHMAIAKSYIGNGATCLSVLTDEKYFQGGLGILEDIASIEYRVPILEKDFILFPYQVYEAKAYGADAVLLIAAKLDDSRIAELTGLAKGLGMAVLAEAHDAAELERILRLGLPLVGINNRNLHDLSVRRETCIELAPMVPEDRVLVAESGIRSSEDRRRIREAGFDAILVGEALVTAPDPGKAVEAFTP